MKIKNNLKKFFTILKNQILIIKKIIVDVKLQKKMDKKIISVINQKGGVGRVCYY